MTINIFKPASRPIPVYTGKESFTQWLLLQNGRDCPVGDLAYDYKRDTFGMKIYTITDFRKRLEWKSEEVREALEEAWREYKRFAAGDLIQESEVQLCLEWLGKQKIIKTPNYRHTSYGYKHIVEKRSGTYISNDSFKEAVRRLKIPHKDELNIYLPISELQLKKTLL